MAAAGRVAWIESPLQLLGAIELGAADGEPLAIVPRAGVTQLDATIAALRPALPPAVTIESSAQSAVRGPFAAARERVIGDVFSGQFRALVARTGVRRLTLVDDGSLTLHLAAALLDGPFARMAQHEGALMRTLGSITARRLEAAARDGRIDLFTVYDDAPGVARLARAGVRVRPNRFAWLRRTDVPGIPILDAPTVVLGSALVTDGQVGAGQYLGWVRALAAESAVLYLPHRRESPAQRRAVAAIANVEVRDIGLPAELVLSRAGSLRRVVTFPSSAVATLAAVLPASARIDVRGVPHEWWTPSADMALRDAFAAIGEHAAGSGDPRESLASD